MNPKYPIYIVSKGRWESRLTSKALERMSVPYHIIVEAQEYEQYAAVIDPAKILVLDPAYQRDYDACMELSSEQSRGSGPARNFVWDHAQASGAFRHWIMDDNIRCFYRSVQGKRIRADTRSILAAMEEFTDRYQNVALSGPNYHYFVNNYRPFPVFVANTRLFSCILIRNDISHRWRGRYNEDVLLSLDVLKEGWATVQFNVFLQGKVSTQTMKGGNTDELYKDGTLAKSQMLVREHPDVSRVVWRFGRWHHHVDYRRFKHNRLILKSDVVIPTEPNEYGMKLVTLGAAAD